MGGALIGVEDHSDDEDKIWRSSAKARLLRKKGSTNTVVCWLRTLGPETGTDHNKDAESTILNFGVGVHKLDAEVLDAKKVAASRKVPSRSATQVSLLTKVCVGLLT